MPNVREARCAARRAARQWRRRRHRRYSACLQSLDTAGGDCTDERPRDVVREPAVPASDTTVPSSHGAAVRS